MEFSASTMAAAKLIAVFALLVVMLRLHVRLWACILAAALAVSLLTGISPAQWPSILLAAFTRPDFILLCIMVFFIMLLSAVQDATGQSRKLVEGLKRYLARPRLRLVIFPALVGLLPMPGGALFSCPMIDAAARNMGISDEKKGLINYWFRHIWETAWPLYPGYALVCALLGVSMTELWKYTFPLVFLSFGVGWLFYMRDLARSPLLEGKACAEGAAPEQARHVHEGVSSAWDESEAEGDQNQSLPQALSHALPIAVTLLGAVFFAFILDRFFPNVPGQAAFSLSLLCAVATALRQGRMKPGKAFLHLAFSRNTARIMLLLASIYIFKECIGSGGLVSDLSSLGDGVAVILLTFLVVPFVSGLLTGIMVGFVGLCFPILLAILEHSPLKEHTLPLIILAMIAGNCGQMLSPLHVCLVVTCEFFNTRLPGFWRALLLPTGCILLGGIVWVCLLAAFGLQF